MCPKHRNSRGNAHWMYYCDSFKAHLSSETSQQDLFPNLHNKLAPKIKIECAINKDHKLVVYNELGAFLSLSLFMATSIILGSWSMGRDDDKLW